MKTLARVAIVGAVLAGCAPSQSGRKVNFEEEAARPAVPPQYLMRGLVSVHFDNLKAKLTVDPATPEEWSDVAMSAALLHEASYLLMRDPPENDDAWVAATSTMLRRGSDDVLAAVDRSDSAAARTALRELSQACSSCHRDCPADDLFGLRATESEG